MTEIQMRTAIEHLASLEGVNVVEAWGETSFFYNPGQRFARGTYLATVKDRDGAGDKGSHLDRAGVWRLNIGVSVKTFADLFGARLARPAKGKVITGPWDFTELNTLTPHPVYGWMGWVAILNPGATSWEQCKPLIEGARERARVSFERRMGT